jgi:hypothetical protein
MGKLGYRRYLHFYWWYNIIIITSLIVKLINKGAQGIYNVGTELKTMYELARKTHPEVKPSFRPSSAPFNISINTNKMKKFLDEN